MTTLELVKTEVEAEVSAVEQAVAEARAQAESIEVHNPEQAQHAAEFLKEVAARKRDAEKRRKELVGPLNDHVKRINAMVKEAVAPLDVADGVVRERLTAYTVGQERIQREEEERLERERQERERKLREERERQEAEARAKAEVAEREAREAAELAEAEKSAEMAKLAEETKAKLAEAETAAAAVEALPAPEVPKAVVKAPPKIDGAHTRKRWVVKSIVLPALPDEYKIADEKAINAAMRDGVRENGQPPEIPGVMFEQVPELAVRA